MAEQIYSLIGQAMKKIGSVGKTSKNAQQGFLYRGIDAVMNALSPVMADLGLFIVPEVLEQTREERTNKNGTTLLYSILKIKYTMFAPDGSNVSCVVIGEGMDTGDKASNKAMAIGLKYAAFQMFMIPTEEMKSADPDAECHEVKPKVVEITQTVTNPAVPAEVVQSVKLPEAKPEPVSPVLEYLAKEREALRVTREVSKAENNAIWKAQIAALTAAGLAPDKPLTAFTMDEAKALIEAMYANFTPTGTVLKDESKPS